MISFDAAVVGLLYALTWFLSIMWAYDVGQEAGRDDMALDILHDRYVEDDER